MTCPAVHVTLKLKTGTVWCRTCHPLGPPLPQVAFNPDHEAHGSGLAPSGRGHKHVMHLCYWTTTGPLAVLMACMFCSKSQVVRPSKRIRKIPEGFNEVSWQSFLRKGQERLQARNRRPRSVEGKVVMPL